MNNTYIFRNYTIEPLFKNFSNVVFSGYEDISSIPQETHTYIWFYICPFNEGEQELIDKISDYKQKLSLVLQNCNPNSLVLLFTIKPISNFGFKKNKKGFFEAIEEYNQNLYTLAGKRTLTKVIRFDVFLQDQNPDILVDWRYYFMYKTVVNPSLSGAFFKWFEKELLAIEGKRKKCLILDLDNTLWGGVLGEEGMVGIQLGNSYPGNVYKTFQKLILEAGKFGVIFAIVSKNNEEDVWEVFEKHPDMVLKRDYIAAWRINWNDKATNISEIAEELNIGTDSMVFIDDSPVERDWIKQALPEVVAPDFPIHPYQIVTYFYDIYNSYFQLYDLTKEDKEKITQYKQNALRKQSIQNYSSIEEYIAGLNIQITIKEADSFTIPRIAQLTQKTNQFNLTTKRYSENDIVNFAKSGDKVYSANISDKFGDNGLTAVCIFRYISTTQMEIDSYLLSCRVLGRNIEYALMKRLLNIAFENNVSEVFATFIPTTKNALATEFYEKLGFELLGNTEFKKYKLKMRDKYIIEPYYTFSL